MPRNLLLYTLDNHYVTSVRVAHKPPVGTVLTTAHGRGYEVLRVVGWSATVVRRMDLEAKAARCD